MLTDRTIVLGVSGSIAAYKAAYLTRLLKEAGADVWPILTANATRFVGAMTFSAMTGHRAVVDLWANAQAGEIGHVELAHRADLLLIAPATADLIARLSLGRADEPLGAVALATRAPWVLAPAMESNMWLNSTTVAHVKSLEDRGAHIVAPGHGSLASGREGVGRMAEPEEIFEVVAQVLSPHDYADQNVLVTAGPTREAIDPVRFLSNPSSGKMGFALARQARRRGAKVTLVTGPTTLAPPPGVNLVRIKTTQELLDACQQHLAESTVVLMAAAPADFRVEAPARQKLKKSQKIRTLSLELEQTPDVLMTLKARAPGRIVVGFAAETHNVIEFAREKIVRKDLDLVVANDVTEPQAGFEADTNAVWLIDREGHDTRLSLASKDAIAQAVLDLVLTMTERG
jgi:phosphopantothenoylcysteine decarboxylase/phosphopantothenate--cysteine ligase